MAEIKSNKNFSASLVSANAVTTTSSDIINPTQRMVQNFLLIWLDSGIDESKQDCQNTLAQLRSVVNDVNIYTEDDEAIDFLSEMNGMKAFLIVENTIAQNILSLIEDIPQLDAIYIFGGDKSQQEEWTKKWVKVQGVYTDMKSICEGLQLAINQCNQDSIAVSFVKMDKEGYSQNLDQLEPTFMYTQIFKEILLEMKHNEQSITNLTFYCRKFYKDNTRELNIIDDFEHNYRMKSPIWWYTRECFTYQMLNRALRTLECDTIINMGFFIQDLHKQIQELYRKQIGTYHGESFTVYRGQGLFIADFEKLQETIGGLMSFSNFLSTSTNLDVCLRFARDALKKTDMVGILFRMTIDPSISSAPFASIHDFSYYKREQEILFSMQTIFRVTKITKIDSNNSLYQVDLQLTADDDQELRILTKLIREEVTGKTGWERLGQLLLRLSQFDRAEELYNTLLEHTSNPHQKVLYYHQLAYTKDNQGDYKKAIEYYEKALEISKNTLHANHSDLYASRINISAVHINMGEYSKALLHYQQELEIAQKTLPADHPHLATFHNNIGGLYQKTGDYSKALSSHEKALEIYQKTLPSNHPDFAVSYNNIARIYDNMGEYSKALSFYEKALPIFKKTLPPSHMSLGTFYNNMGMIYYNMGKYSEALSSHEKALEIRQKNLPSNHPDLAASYNNIATIYNSIGEYSKALSFYEKDVEICRQTLPSDHPDLATSYNNMGEVYRNIGEYSKALSFYEQGISILEKTFPSNHFLFGNFYSNIGTVYFALRDYPKTQSFYERALKIFQSSLPENHPNIKGLQTSIEILRTML